MKLSWDREVDAAYLNLLPPDEARVGESRTQVPLAGVEAGSGVGALDSIVLDFDRDGLLIGIEFLGARGALRASTLSQAG